MAGAKGDVEVALMKMTMAAMVKKRKRKKRRKPILIRWFSFKALHLA